MGKPLQPAFGMRGNAPVLPAAIAHPMQVKRHRTVARKRNFDVVIAIGVVAWAILVLAFWFLVGVR